MTTQAATFESKIRTLHECYNNIVNGQSQAVTLGTDLVVTLKYFSNSLLNVLKEISLDDNVNDGATINNENDENNLDDSAKDMAIINDIEDNLKQSNISDTNNKNNNEKVISYSLRIKQFPNLNFSQLYHTLLNIIEIVPTMQSNQMAIGHAVIHTLSCLSPFLSNEIIETLPYTMTLTLASFPIELHKFIMDNLCNTILPIALYYNENTSDSFLSNSIPSLIMIVFEHGMDIAFFTQLLECLLSLKRNLIQDILSAIAYGTYQVRYHAANLMFYYFPGLSPLKSEKLSNYYSLSYRQPTYCQSERCDEKKNIAIKICANPTLSVHGSKYPPPYYICNECFRELPKHLQNYCNNLLQPSEEISMYCQNRNCKSDIKSVYSICYSSSCTILNHYKPISFCKKCHLIKHNDAKINKNHIYQICFDSIWVCDVQIQNYLTTTIISLLKETPALEFKKNAELGAISYALGTLAAAANTNQYLNTNIVSNPHDLSNSHKIEKTGFNKRLLSRYGCYLVIKLVNPDEVNDIEIFGRILSMMFHWFDMVCYVPADMSGELISKFRTQHVVPWIKNVVEKHTELVICCLLPYPPHFSKVGGVWETKSNRVTQIKEEFNKFCCLIPYDIITFEIWNYIMPYWLEAIIQDVSDKSLNELKTLFTKLFDPEMTPIAFSKDQMYTFVSERFNGTPSSIQEQALSWLQVLCAVDVIIPINIMLQTFHMGLNSLQKLESRAMRREAYVSAESELHHQIQMQLYNNAFPVFDTYDAYKVYRNQFMLQKMTGQELAQLIREEEEDFIINDTELNITCCIMMLDMILKQMNLQKLPQCLGMYNPMSKDLILLLNKHLILPWAKRHKCKTLDFLNPERESNNITQLLTPVYCSLCEEHVLWTNFAKEILIFISPKQEIELPEINLNDLVDPNSNKLQAYHYFHNFSHQQKQIFNGHNAHDGKSNEEIDSQSVNQTNNSESAETNPETDVWVTSNGTYYFKLANLHIHLQLLYSILKELNSVPDVDSLNNLLVCLKMLVLHGECLETAAKDQKGLLIYCLEKLLIPNLWKLLGANYCHLNEVVIQLLLHSLVYESGKNALWNIIDKEFKSSSWKSRMQAVSRVVTMVQHLNPKYIRTNCNVYSCLSFAFTHFINTTKDIDPLVFQKSISYIETLSESAIKSILLCFELQFDSVIADRIIILQTLFTLYSTIYNSKTQIVFTWEFFMQRFNTLSVEAQISLEEIGGDILTPIDISGVNTNTTLFQNKIKVAKFAILQTPYIRSISQSFESQKHLTVHVDDTSKANVIDTNGNSNDKEKDKDTPENEIYISFGTKNAKNIQKNETLTLENDDYYRKTLHLLIGILMKFMVYDDQSAVSEDRIMLKHQNVVIKHVYSLIGYNQNEQNFYLPAYKLRRSAATNAFISGLPNVMDRNFVLGNILLPVVLRLLKYLPSPTNDANSSVKSNNNQNLPDMAPYFTIQLLHNQARHSWLSTFLIILYKYQYNNQNDSYNHTESIKYLMRIVLNTLNSQSHKCQFTSSDLNEYNDTLRWQKDTAIDAFFTDSLSQTGDNTSTIINGAVDHDQMEDAASERSSTLERTGKNRIIPQNKSVYKSRTSLRLSIQTTDSAHDDVRMIRKKSSKQGFVKGIKLLVSTNGTKEVAKILKIGKSGRGAIIETTSLKAKDESLTPKGSQGNLYMSTKTSKSMVKMVKNRKDLLLNHSESQMNPLLKKPKKSFSKFKKHSQGLLQQDFLLNFSGATAALATAAALCSNIDGDETIFSNATQSSKTLLNNSQLNGGITNDHHSQMAFVRCEKCGTQIETYNEEIIGTLIVICSTLVHRDCNLAATDILEMIISITKIAAKKIYNWQSNSNYYIPGHYASIAKQFIRCVLHQLAGNEIFYQLFQSDFENANLIETIASALYDFNELSSVAALKQIIHDLNQQKCLNLDVCLNILNNVAIFIEYLPTESQSQQWLFVFQEFEALFRQLDLIMHKSKNYTCLFLIVIHLLKVPFIATSKSILEPLSKLLNFILRNSTFKLDYIIDICALCIRAFTKERDRQYIPRSIINDFVQSITLKVHCVDKNLLLLLQFAVLDAGGSIYPSSIIASEISNYDPHYLVQTNAAECLKQYTNEIVSFIEDIHTITKIKQSMKTDKQYHTYQTEDTLGAQLKAGLAQFLALEFTELNKSKDRDSRSITKYFPWLCNIPSNAQQGAKEFVECIDHIRFLSWILLGSLTHSALTRNRGTVICYPIPITCGNYIGEHVFYILNGFAEHSKTSAIHMSSLFHSFILCQLWTMYCEQIHVTYDTENDQSALNSIMEYWTKVTPGILQLVSQNKVLAEMVVLHFLSLIEGLQEYNSLVLAKFFPMWVPVLYMAPLQGDQLKRAKQCLNHQPPTESQINLTANYSILMKCLQRLQFKISMIESQSSNAAQLYNV